jgi:predicted MFS family arabinose efflux permease
VENFLYGYVVVAVVLHAHEEGRAEQVGWLNSAFAAGAVVSMLVVNRIAARGRPAATLRLVLVATAAAVALLGAVGATPAGVALVAVAGAGCVVVEVLAVTLLQRAAPAHELAGLFGAFDQLNVGMLACGSLLAGPLIAAWGARPVTVGVSAACLAAAYLVTAACRDRAHA